MKLFKSRTNILKTIFARGKYRPKKLQANKLQAKRGFSLVEMLVYIAILTVVSVLVVNTMLSTGQAYNNLKVSRIINSSAVVSLERMTREIRSADGIVTLGSSFGSHPGRLTLQTSSTAIEFYIDNNALKIRENGIDAGSLIQQESQVTNLIFRLLDNGTSKAVRIEMTLLGEHSGITKTEKFYSFIVLRNSY